MPNPRISRISRVTASAAPVPTGKKPWFVVNRAAGSPKAEVCIYGEIGDLWFGATQEFVNWRLEELEGAEEVTVRINSLGGLMNEGLGMYYALKNCGARIVVYVECIAASAATLPAMAADELVMYANSCMMIHGVAFLDECGEEITDSEAARVFNNAAAETYAARTGKPMAEIEAMLQTTTWMTAREAVAAGWADRVEELSALPDVMEQGGELDDTPAAVMAVMASAAAGIPRDVARRVLAQARTEPSASKGGDPSPAPATPAAEPPAADPARVAGVGATFAAKIKAAVDAAGLSEHLHVFALADGVETEADIARILANACEVRDLCAFSGVTAEAATQFVRSLRPVAEVRRSIVDARAAQSDALPTDPLPPVGGVAPAGQAASTPLASLGDVYARSRAAARALFPTIVS